MDYHNRLRKSEWKVAPIGFAYTKTHSKVAVALHGLFSIHGDYNVLPYGVCWWLPLPSPSAARYFHEDFRNVLCLSRMVLTPDAPKNAASFLLARSIKLLPARYHTLATYAYGYQGHSGLVYQACNWTALGPTGTAAVWKTANGELVSIRRGQRTLTKEEMTEAGYEFCGYHAKRRFVYYRHEPLALPVQLELFGA